MKHTKDKINYTIQKFLITNILPNLFEKYNTVLKQECAGAYMVVVGGINVQHCANKNVLSKSMIRNLLSEDIDIKFVVLNNDVIDKVNKVRRVFIHDVLKELSKPFKDKPNEVTFKVDTHWFASHSVYETKLEVISILLSFDVYNELYTTKFKRIPILDTSLFTRKSSPLFFSFKNILKTKLPIPFEQNGKILYGTCDFAYIDTFRMLLEKLNVLMENPNVFSLLKFYRYVIKFMCLYLMRQKIRGLSPKIRMIYNEVYSSLSEIDTLRLETSLAELIKIKLPINSGKIFGLFEDVLKSTTLSKLIGLHKKALTRINFANAY